MSKTDRIHHYTSIETLALILKHRTIRFNRLDRVDDVSEARFQGEHDVAKYLFVSCWTDVDKEDIPQWHIYSDKATGVRISLPRNPFHYRPLHLTRQSAGITEEGTLSPIPMNRLITESHFIMPYIFKNTEGFECKVSYDDEKTEEVRNNPGISIGTNERA